MYNARIEGGRSFQMPNSRDRDSPRFHEKCGQFAFSLGPNDLDNTFGPQLRYIKAPTKEQGQNLSPALGLQFFGHVAIDGATEVMTVTLKDVDDHALWSTKLEPKVG